jgi:hypothetical protein
MNMEFEKYKSWAVTKTTWNRNTGMKFKKKIRKTGHQNFNGTGNFYSGSWFSEIIHFGSEF